MAHRDFIVSILWVDAAQRSVHSRRSLQTTFGEAAPPQQPAGGSRSSRTAGDLTNMFRHLPLFVYRATHLMHAQ